MSFLWLGMVIMAIHLKLQWYLSYNLIEVGTALLDSVSKIAKNDELCAYETLAAYTFLRLALCCKWPVNHTL